MPVVLLFHARTHVLLLPRPFAAHRVGRFSRGDAESEIFFPRAPRLHVSWFEDVAFGCARGAPLFLSAVSEKRPPDCPSLSIHVATIPNIGNLGPQIAQRGAAATKLDPNKAVFTGGRRERREKPNLRVFLRALCGLLEMLRGLNAV